MSDLKDEISRVINNPMAMQRIMLQHLQAGGINPVNPTLPFVKLMEVGLTAASAAVDTAAVLTRKQYPSMAQTEADLYLHMADEDYLNRFNKPSRTVFELWINRNEIYSRAVATDIPNVRKIVIPRDTEFTLEDTTFTMSYPIDIRIMAHGGLQIVYDTSKPNPLVTLESNIVDWTVRRLNNVDYVKLNIPVQQVKISRTYIKINQTGAFTERVKLTDGFYHARVYISAMEPRIENGVPTEVAVWKEIRTTHTDQVYDHTTPTAVLQVFSDEVSVHIPPVYFSQSMVDTEVRVDVYQTKGPLDINFGSFIANAFGSKFIDAEGESSRYVAPLSQMSEMSVYNQSVTTGGEKALTFEQLRERTITNPIGKVSLPITNIQIGEVLQDSGYRVVKSIDLITNRVFLATRALPNPNLPNNAVGAGAIMASFQARAVDLAALETAKDNGDRVTLLPTTLFKNENGVIKIVPKTQVDALKAAGNEAIVTASNSNNFLFTPFHYVYDTSNDRFNLRGYYLDAPAVEYREFVDENDTVPIEVGIGNFGIAKVANGYEIVISTRSGETFKALNDNQIFPQLSYMAVEEEAYAYVNGVFLGTDPETNERVYKFVLETTYDLNEEDSLYFNNFKMFDIHTLRELPTRLLTAFNIVFVIGNYSVSGMQTSALDQNVGSFLLPPGLDNWVAVVRERLGVRFGHALRGLWSNARSLASSIEYETYPADVPYIFEKDVYQTEPDGSYTIVDNNGVPDFVKLHSAGDTKMENGAPVIRHRAGSLKRDNDGNPIPKSPRALIRQADLFMIDGRFYFANSQGTLNYIRTVPATIVEWLRNDIVPIGRKMLEQTLLYFYPLTTTGNVKVIGESSAAVSIPAEQKFSLQLFVDEQTFKNMPLRAEMRKSATQTIANGLDKNTVSHSDLVARLKEVLGAGVKGINLSRLAGELDINTITVVDDSQRMVIGKRLIEDGDGFLSVEDDIEVTFSLHSLT